MNNIDNKEHQERFEKAKELCNNFFADYMTFGPDIALEQLVTVMAGKPRDVEKYLDPKYEGEKK